MQGAAGPSPDAHALDRQLDARFARFTNLSRIGVAVSGGPDSMALFLALHRWRERQHHAPALFLLTVDHGLRAGSRTDSERAQNLAARLGHSAECLVWQHDSAPPSADLQAAARDARYRLLAGAAHRLRLDLVCLAHTLDDRAETFLMRLQRGSGVAGLAAMQDERVVDGIRFVRPLLDIRKASLIAYLNDAGVAYAEDPSNQADRFLRVQIRKLMPDLAAAGLTAERLVETAARLTRANAALDHFTDRLEADAVTDHGGVVSLRLAALTDAPADITLRLLARLLRQIRPAPYPPRADALEAWQEAFERGDAPARSTMAGVVLEVRKDTLWLYAEAGRTGFPERILPLGERLIWDERFVIDATAAISGTAGMFRVRNTDPGHLTPGLPKAAAASLPAIYSPEDIWLDPADHGVTLHPLCQRPAAYSPKWLTS